VQVQHRALDLHAFFRRQPPAVQLHAVGGGKRDIAVFEMGLFRGEQLAGLGVEQQRAATVQGQEEADDAEDSHPFGTSQKM